MRLSNEVQRQGEAVLQDMRRRGVYDWANGELYLPENAKPARRRPLPKDQQGKAALLISLEKFVDWLRRLIESVQHRVNKAYHSPADGSILEMINQQVKSLIATPATHLLADFAPYLGWERDKQLELSCLLIAYEPSEFGGKFVDLLNELNWTYELENRFLQAPERLSKALRIPSKSSTASATRDQRELITVTINGDSSRIHSPLGDFAVELSVAVFIKEVVDADGRPVACNSINEKHKNRMLDLRAGRIRKKIPKELQEFFITVQSGTFFDKKRLAEVTKVRHG